MAGDVYKLLVKALSLDPPQLTFRYQSLVDRIAATSAGKVPSGSSVTCVNEQGFSLHAEVRLAINQRTGKYYPPAGPRGVFGPETGAFSPKAGQGFVDPKTGHYYPAPD